MALSIKSDEADALARELSAVTGESLTAAVTEALRERLERERRSRGGRDVAAVIAAAQERMRDISTGDAASSADFLYDDRGLPA